jgi:hypothetical protein
VKRAPGAFLLLLLLSACRQDPPQGSSATASASVSPSVSPSPSVSEAPSAPKTTPTISDWSKPDAGQPVEVANAPDRAAVVVFDATKGGYVLERGGQSRALPREWFGVGPPRRDVSISADGKRLAIPDGDDVVIYDTDTSRWMARIKAPQPGAQALRER